jgi:hypothetical protein
MTGEDCSSSTESPASHETGDILLQSELDLLFESLSASDRRLILLLVKEGILETESDVRDWNSKEYEIDPMTSHHLHLPKLHSCGYIEWDRDTGKISTGSRFNEIESLLELIQNNQNEFFDRWQ